ncbi:methyltransferase [Hyphomicrobium methylovorum]|uniref:class I SAM-dependent methyltransferase n=1 Tax=Hyphomicrobium methylovorum TaxID=84 RepID=UPI0015E7A007|nr:class I SAM-dependent methyltransferase [Hyphomicrobium methylovorum]MBA2125887.1 methyltransferase [Hyphomicrobium methylovorum]
MEQFAYREMAEAENAHWWFVGRRKIIESVLAGLELPKSASILEVGAGTGGNLSLLQRFGHVQAMELDAYARDFANKRSGVLVVEGRLPDNLPFEEKQFDLICLFDVLEHVKPDVESLKAISRLLKPDGRIVITVPAYQWMWSEHDVTLHHFRRYSVATLQQTLSAAALQSERLTHFNALLFPLALIVRAANSIFKSSRSPGTKMPSPLVNALLLKVFSSERHILRFGGLPFGLSLLAIAKL